MNLLSRLFSRPSPPRAAARPATDMGTRRKKQSGAGKTPPAASLRIKPVFSLLLALLIFSGSIWLGKRFQQEARFYEIEVQGTELSAVEQVLETAELRTGMPADSLQVLALLARVEALPQIRRAELELPAPDRLRLMVTERRPAAILVEGNRFALVDHDGIIMPMPKGRHPDLPLLYGFGIGQPGDSLKTEGFRKIAEFLLELEQAAIAGATISELGWHPEDGVFGLSHQHSVKLLFGHADYSVRLRKWERFYRDVALQRGMQAFLSLDFRFKDQIVAQEQQVPSS